MKLIAWGTYPVLLALPKYFPIFFIAYLRDSDKSLLISDLISSLGEVVRFVNDRALEKIRKHLDDVDRSKIQQLLGFLEVAEVFLEIAALLAGGEVAKWTVIVIIQTLKLVYNCKN